MSTFILYIEDNEKNNGVTISAEHFGYPAVAMEIGESIFASLAAQKAVKVANNSVYTQEPTTEYVQ